MAELQEIENEQTEPDRIIYLQRENVIIKFPYDSKIVEAVRLVEFRRYNPNNKTWEVPKLNKDNIKQIIDLSEEFEFHIKDTANEYFSSIINPDKKKFNLDLSFLSYSLHPFQVKGVQFILNRKRTFLADDMGLGKTIQALATMAIVERNIPGRAFPALVVCPATVKYNWLRELNKWLPDIDVKIIDSKEKLSDFDGQITIINYDLLIKFREELISKRYNFLIFDESHYCKNYKAKRTQVAKDLSEGAEYIICLSGTPVVNHPVELIPQLEILGRLEDISKNKWEFMHKYCDAKETKYGWDFTGTSNLPELNQKLKESCYIRRIKKEVLQELPDKQRQVILLDIDNREEYSKAETNLIQFLIECRQASNEKVKKALRAHQLVQIETLKQLVAEGKMEQVIEWIENFLETEEKLVVFASHIEVQKRLLKHFPTSLHVFGEDSSKARMKNVSEFQSDPEKKLIICSLNSGAEGITLHSSSNVAFIELAWTPAKHEQAEDRLHRMGQRNSVNSYYLLGKDTIEDGKIYKLIEKKNEICQKLTDGDTKEFMELSIFDELITELSGIAKPIKAKRATKKKKAKTKKTPDKMIVAIPKPESGVKDSLK